MFKQAKAFNQDLTAWQVGQMTKKSQLGALQCEKVLQVLRARKKQCAGSAQEMPEGLQVRGDGFELSGSAD